MKNNTIKPTIANPFQDHEYHLLTRALITPDVAKEILAHYSTDMASRAPVNLATVKTFETALQQGKVDLETGNVLRFEAVTGDLLDGRARLMAVVNTGIALVTSVAVGCSPKSLAYSK